MCRPIHFGFNPETAGTNIYQHTVVIETSDDIRTKALREFDGMVQKLTDKGIVVFELPTRLDVVTPDAVFPNNWFSTHREGSRGRGTVSLYPMLAPNRRDERQTGELLTKLHSLGLKDPYIYDLTHHEEDGHFFEGTGSMVLDRQHKIAYAVESQRTQKIVYDEWVNRMGYESMFARASDTENPPYHTNVVLSVGTNYAVVCPDIIDERERSKMMDKLHETKQDVIEITLEQVSKFCGNILEVQNEQGDPHIVLSHSAYRGFTELQRKKLSLNGNLVPVDIDTIENVGGGSARCMIAEVFLHLIF